jgi:hypothetical protein
MFKASESTTVYLMVIEGSSRAIIDYEIEQLKVLGVDIPLMFSRGQWLPDWEIADTFPDAVQAIVTDIYRRGQEREYALGELVLRRYPN